MIVYKSWVVIISMFIGSTFSEKCQKAILYSQFNGEGENYVIMETYKANFHNESFDNKAHSTCVTGIWLFYEDSDFNPVGSRRVEYVFGRNNYCVNLKTINGDVSSVRYAGHPQNYTADSITIYQFDYFQGKEEYIFTQLDNLDTLKGDHQSIIITGSSDWTVFDQPNFAGNSLCLKVPESKNNIPSFIADLSRNAEVSIPYGSIKSVRKGCISGYNVNMTSFGISTLFQFQM